MMVVESVSMLLGRDRICAVLEPLLGQELARERANNIAQVLVLSGHDPAHVALGMLRGTGLGDLPRVASEVSRAWRDGIGSVLARESEFDAIERVA
jgi:hypothetical protein